MPGAVLRPDSEAHKWRECVAERRADSTWLSFPDPATPRGKRFGRLRALEPEVATDGAIVGAIAHVCAFEEGDEQHLGDCVHVRTPHCTHCATVPLALVDVVTYAVVPRVDAAADGMHCHGVALVPQMASTQRCSMTASRNDGTCTLFVHRPPRKARTIVNRQAPADGAAPVPARIHKGALSARCSIMPPCTFRCSQCEGKGTTAGQALNRWAPSATASSSQRSLCGCDCRRWRWRMRALHPWQHQDYKQQAVAAYQSQWRRHGGHTRQGTKPRITCSL